MGWAEQHKTGAGTTRQIEDAHKALDEAGILKGPLALRAMEAAGVIIRLQEENTDGG